MLMVQSTLYLKTIRGTRKLNELGRQNLGRFPGIVLALWNAGRKVIASSSIGRVRFFSPNLTIRATSQMERLGSHSQDPSTPWKRLRARCCSNYFTNTACLLVFRPGWPARKIIAVSVSSIRNRNHTPPPNLFGSSVGSPSDGSLPTIWTFPPVDFWRQGCKAERT